MNLFMFYRSEYNRNSILFCLVIFNVYIISFVLYRVISPVSHHFPCYLLINLSILLFRIIFPGIPHSHQPLYYNIYVFYAVYLNLVIIHYYPWLYIFNITKNTMFFAFYGFSKKSQYVLALRNGLIFSVFPN